MFWRKEVKPPVVAPEYSEPDAAPDYLDANPTYAPKLGVSHLTHVQQSEMLGRTFRPNAGESPEGFWRHANAAEIANYPAEYLQGDEGLPLQFEEQPAAIDPRRHPAKPERYTANISPTTYRFWRPFDQHSARQLNGNHFSMADNMREYEIFGMAPITSRRNTYRAEPGPWDANIVDKTADLEPDNPQAVYISPEVPPTQGTQSWRL